MVDNKERHGWQAKWKGTIFFWCWWQKESRIRMERDVFVFLLTHLSYACSHFVDPFWWWRQHLQAPTLLVLCIGWCNHFTICRATRALLVNMQAKENFYYCQFQSLAHIRLRSWTTEICTLQVLMRIFQGIPGVCLAIICYLFFLKPVLTLCRLNLLCSNCIYMLCLREIIPRETHITLWHI